MLSRKFVLVCTVFVCLAGAVSAQSLEDTTIIPLTVEQGFPLQVCLTEKVQFRENEPIRATLAEPVYAFDREVIPSGTKIEGKITGFRKAAKWKRISSMAGGDFTPQREPIIMFDSLVLSNGDRIPIETSVVSGPEKVVGSDQPDQASKTDKNSLVSTVKKSGTSRLKDMLWGLAPYHPQYLPAGTAFTAVLQKPLDFGEAVFRNGALDDMGVAPPAGSIVSIRLVTPLNSGTTPVGSNIEALLTRPLFSPEHQLIFPVGTRFQGKISDVAPARALHHNGRLGFTLTTITPPQSLFATPPRAQEVEGHVANLEVGHDMRDLHIDGNGSAQLVESKKRLIGPAWAFIKAGRSLNVSEDSFGTALLGAYRGKFLKQITGADAGFGLPASISGAMFPPVGIGFGFYGAARSVYSNFLRRGRDINLPANTLMDIRLDKITAP